MHLFRSMGVLLICACALAGLLGCERDQQVTNSVDAPAVEQKIAKLMDALKANDYDTVIQQYDEDFFKNSDPRLWRDKLQKIMAERGPMQSYSLAKSQADTRFSGKFYILEYNSVHDGNKRLHHIFTLIAPVNGDDIKLVGHKITPWEKTG